MTCDCSLARRCEQGERARASVSRMISNCDFELSPHPLVLLSIALGERSLTIPLLKGTASVDDCLKCFVEVTGLRRALNHLVEIVEERYKGRMKGRRLLCGRSHG